MVTKLTFDANGLPAQVQVPAGDRVVVEFTEAGKQELERAANYQSIRTEYHGIDTWAATAKGVRTNAAGDTQEFGNRFARTETVPGTGTPGMKATQVHPVELGTLKPGERVRLWIEIQGGGGTGYWSNCGKDINIEGK